MLTLKQIFQNNHQEWLRANDKDSIRAKATDIINKLDNTNYNQIQSELDDLYKGVNIDVRMLDVDIRFDLTEAYLDLEIDKLNN